MLKTVTGCYNTLLIKVQIVSTASFVLSCALLSTVHLNPAATFVAQTAWMSQ